MNTSLPYRKHPRRTGAAALVLAASLALAACGDDAADQASTADSATGAPGALTADELEHGIGPIRNLELGAVDAALASAGETAFALKCSACHHIEDRYVGPRLGTVLARRSPEFVMNMILNANEMVQRHPVTRELLAQFYTPMPVQVTDQDEARAILEYLRSVQIDSLATAAPDPAGGDR